MELILHDLKFDPERADSGYCVGGLLYISFENAFFPGENWYDMPYLDLKTWLPRLISFGSSHTDSCILTFMDGPYAVRLARSQDDAVTVSCLCDHKIVTEREIDFGLFVKSVIACCRKYDKFLYENGKKPIFSEEIKQLKLIL